EAEENFERAAHYNTRFTGIRSDRAKLYFVAEGWLIEGGYKKAEEDLRYVVDHNPLDWDARIGLVNVYQVQGYFSKALRVLERGRTWPMPLGRLGLSLLVMEADLHLKMGNRAGYDALQAQAKDFAIKNGMMPAPAPAVKAAD
ncbi:MAG: tetratricopeptide repeat protein, partial [Alphaproteobacteria bacterium]|nr:tetratricopeptide repeat protein [Alphaproteobacteria bacterium]